MKWFNWKSDPKPSVQKSRPPGRPTNVVQSFLRALKSTKDNHTRQTSGKRSRVGNVDKKREEAHRKANDKQIRQWKKAGYGLEGYEKLRKHTLNDRYKGPAQRIKDRLNQKPSVKKPKGTNSKSRIAAATAGQAPNKQLQQDLQGKQVFKFPGTEQMTSITNHDIPKGLLDAAREILQENRQKIPGPGTGTAVGSKSDLYHVIDHNGHNIGSSTMKDDAIGMSKRMKAHKVVYGKDGHSGQVVHVNESEEPQLWIGVDSSEINESNQHLVEKVKPGWYVRNNLHDKSNDHGTIYSGPHASYTNALEVAIGGRGLDRGSMTAAERDDPSIRARTWGNPLSAAEHLSLKTGKRTIYSKVNGKTRKQTLKLSPSETDELTARRGRVQHHDYSTLRSGGEGIHTLHYYDGKKWYNGRGGGITHKLDSAGSDKDQVGTPTHGHTFLRALGRRMKTGGGLALGHTALTGAMAASAGGAIGGLGGAATIGGIVTAGTAAAHGLKGAWNAYKDSDRYRAKRLNRIREDINEGVYKTAATEEDEEQRLSGKKSSKEERREAILKRVKNRAKKGKGAHPFVEVSGDKEPDNDKDDKGVHEAVDRDTRLRAAVDFHDRQARMYKRKGDAANRAGKTELAKAHYRMQERHENKGDDADMELRAMHNESVEQVDEGLRTAVNYLSGRRRKVTDAYVKHKDNQAKYHAAEFDKALERSKASHDIANAQWDAHYNSGERPKSRKERIIHDGGFDNARDAVLAYSQKQLNAMDDHRLARSHADMKSLDVRFKGAKALPRLGTKKEDVDVEDQDVLDEAKKVRLTPGGNTRATARAIKDAKSGEKTSRASKAVQSGKKALAMKAAKKTKPAASSEPPAEKSWRGSTSETRTMTAKLHHIKNQDIKQKAAKWLMDKNNHLPDLSGKALHDWALDKFGEKKSISLAGKTK